MFIDTVLHQLQIRAAKGDEVSGRYLSAMKAAERFRIDNIADYLREVYIPTVDGGMDVDLASEIPNVAPVAAVMWFEMAGDLAERTNNIRSGCLLVVAHDVKEDGREPSIPESARWIVIATLFVVEGKRFFMGNACHGVAIGSDGKPLEVQALRSPFLSEEEYSVIPHDSKQTSMSPCLFTALFALCFCHCKNVTIEAEKVSRQVRRAAERAKEPMLTFKTIDIHPIRKVMSEEGQIEHQGLKRALHICRAHFAHYTQEHPLFGKYVGTFYRPMHLRGDREKGVVIKDYSIHET